MFVSVLRAPHDAPNSIRLAGPLLAVCAVRALRELVTAGCGRDGSGSHGIVPASWSHENVANVHMIAWSGCGGMFSGVAIGSSDPRVRIPSSVDVAPERGRVRGGWNGRIRRLLRDRIIIHIHGTRVAPQIALVAPILVR